MTFLQRVSLWALLLFPVFTLPLHAQTAGNTISIGQSLPLGAAGKGDVLRASRLQQGALAYLEKVNRRGGVNGVKIQLRTLDDAADSGRLKSNLATLAADGSVLALMGMSGGGNCRTAMGVAQENRLALLGCMAGSPQMRQGGDGWVFNIRPGHDAEYKRMAAHFKSTGITTAFFVHDDNDTGRLHVVNATAAMQAAGITLVGSAAVSNKSKAPELAQAIRQSAARGVFNQGPNALFADIVVEARKANLHTLQFMSVCSGADTIVSQLGEASRGITFTQVVPFPFATDTFVPLVHEYQMDMQETFKGAAFSYDSFEAYINARVLVLALQKAGPKPTRERLAAAIRSLGKVDLSGFRLAFGPDATAASGFVDLVMASPGRDRPFIR
jgi:branched-chain amino acid transport system substrate-binding protein